MESSSADTECVDAGDFGELYWAARDGAQQRRVVKRSRGVDGDAILRNEAHIYAHLREHDPTHWASEVVETTDERGYLMLEMPYFPLTIERAVDTFGRAHVVAAALRALQALHRANVVHQDIKPEHVVFTADGLARIVDYGFSRIEQGRTLWWCEGMVGNVRHNSRRTMRLLRHYPLDDLEALLFAMYRLWRNVPWEYATDHRRIADAKEAFLGSEFDVYFDASFVPAWMRAWAQYVYNESETQPLAQPQDVRYDHVILSIETKTTSTTKDEDQHAPTTA